MIDVSNLTKTYGSTLALDHVSLSIQPGEVVGLLGPNGAGKTTMLKILTGYLPPTEGTATVANFDVLDASLQVRHGCRPFGGRQPSRTSTSWTPRSRFASASGTFPKPIRFM